MHRAIPRGVALVALLATPFVPSVPPRPNAPVAPRAASPPPWPPVGGQEPAETHDDVVAAYHQLAPEVPRDVMARRVALNLPRKAVLREIGGEPSFAGSRYDYGTGLWHLLGTDQARLDVWAGWARAKGIDPAPRLVKYAYADLEARVRRIRAGTDPLSSYAPYGVGIDVHENHVTVVVPERPDVEDDMVVWVGFGDAQLPEITPG